MFLHFELHRSDMFVEVYSNDTQTRMSVLLFKKQRMFIHFELHRSDMFVEVCSLEKLAP